MARRGCKGGGGRAQVCHRQQSAARSVSDNTLSGSAVACGSVDGAHALTVNGATTLGAGVGNGAQLAALTVNGAVGLDGGVVRTTGAQTYNGAATLGVDNTLSGSSVAFASTVDGAHALTGNGAGTRGG